MPESKPFADQANVIAADLALKFDMQNMIAKLTGQLALTEQRLRDLVEAIDARGDHIASALVDCGLCDALTAARVLLEDGKIEGATGKGDSTTQ